MAGKVFEMTETELVFGASAGMLPRLVWFKLYLEMTLFQFQTDKENGRAVH